MWIQTFTGIKFDFLNITEDMIVIEDVAHHLSINNRFVGATKFAYSVGYHSLLACLKAPENLKLEALLHELDEPYINDITYPLKKLLNQHTSILHEISITIKELGIKKFKLDDSQEARDIIQNIDCRLAITEEKQLMKNFGYINGDKYTNLEPYDDIDILKLQPENVEQLFLKEYEKWRRC